MKRKRFSVEQIAFVLRQAAGTKPGRGAMITQTVDGDDSLPRT